MTLFNRHRWWAMVSKEFVQLRRDRLTFAMMVGIPLLQLILFGFAINGDPKHLPTVVVAEEQSPFTRSLVSALTISDYFAIESTSTSSLQAQSRLSRGEIQFILTIPKGFSRAIQRGEQPVLLLEADASDPMATVNAMGAMQQLAPQVLRHDLTGPLASLQPTHSAPFELRVQRHYNPEGITQYNTVPGLMGVVLTLTMTMMTALGITRESERGTMENLLATPIRPLEVMLGKITPYVLIGLVQVCIILIATRWLFAVPFVGSLPLLLGVTLIYITANLVVGITLSTLARSQMQAMQMTVFYFLPSILLSGFMFPFRGMPGWAQVIGEILPVTHFIRMVRGILLRGNTLADLHAELWPLLLFTLLILLLGAYRFRRTLD